jgi:hypothetical protein
MLSGRFGQRHLQPGRHMIHTLSVVLFLVAIAAEVLVLIVVGSYRRQRRLALATTRSRSPVPGHKA